jgi:hypothetical protein
MSIPSSWRFLFSEELPQELLPWLASFFGRMMSMSQLFDISWP